jgi:hypothetical protein
LLDDELYECIDVRNEFEALPSTGSG